jgi:hypothetical protein
MPMSFAKSPFVAMVAIVLVAGSMRIGQSSADDQIGTPNGRTLFGCAQQPFAIKTGGLFGRRAIRFRRLTNAHLGFSVLPILRFLRPQLTTEEKPPPFVIPTRQAFDGEYLASRRGAWERDFAVLLPLASSPSTRSIRPVKIGGP